MSPVRSELTKEKNLWQIYRASRKIPGSRFNNCVAVVSAIILSFYAFTSTEPQADLVERVLKWSEFGFSSALNILAFLLAGFTVFATITRQDLMIALADHTHEQSGLSYLKYNLFLFYRVFVYLLAFAFFCICIYVFCPKNGAATLIVGKHLSEAVKQMIVKVGIVLIGSGFVAMLLELQSFVFNIYHVVMTSIRWSAEEFDDQNNASSVNPEKK